MAAFAALSFMRPVYAKEIPVSKETNCIALAIQNEAGNQSIQGMKAVGHVVINRSHSGVFPNNVCRVVYEKHGRHCQFSWACSKKNHVIISDKALLAARISLSEKDFTMNSISFHVTKIHPRWRLNRTVTIGSHEFYALTNVSQFRKTRTNIS